jgi:CDP-L-myo-inositol myo-inositolphosphotransferase
MADHLFDPSIARELMARPLCDGEIALGVDRNTRNSFIDMEDVTRVKTNGDKILNIGKGLTDFNGFDTGIFKCTPAIFSVLERSAKQDGDTTLSAAVQMLAAAGKAKAVEINGRFWIDVDDPAALSRAEDVILTNLKAKPNDGPVSRYLNRPISVRISRRLVQYRITPNQISILSFIVALISTLFFFMGNAITAAILIQISSILDGCDGEIARLKHMQSSFGDFIDAVFDRYADGFIFLGIFYYSLSEIGNKEIFGFYWGPLILSIIIVFAILGNLMVSYTSSKSVVNFGYRYTGKWIAAGRGRDIRLFQLFIGGIMTYFHPIFVLFAVLIIAIQTNVIVIWRTSLSWNWFRKKNSLIKSKIKAVIFDFDGTVANTMPFLTELAVKLLAENYNISKDVAQKRYLETTGLNFARQIELIFPSHPNNQEVVNTFESMKRKGILAHPVFPEVISTFRYFDNKKIKTFICSSTSQELITSYTKLNKIDNLLEGSFGYKPGFGKGEQIDFVLQQYKLHAEEVLFVGDSLRDFDFVKDKKIKFLGITRIFKQKDFQRIGALTVNCLTDLVNRFRESEKYLNALENVN